METEKFDNVLRRLGIISTMFFFDKVFSFPNLILLLSRYLWSVERYRLIFRRGRRIDDRFKNVLHTRPRKSNNHHILRNRTSRVRYQKRRYLPEDVTFLALHLEIAIPLIRLAMCEPHRGLTVSAISVLSLFTSDDRILC